MTVPEFLPVFVDVFGVQCTLSVVQCGNCRKLQHLISGNWRKYPFTQHPKVENRKKEVIRSWPNESAHVARHARADGGGRVKCSTARRCEDLLAAALGKELILKSCRNRKVDTEQLTIRSVRHGRMIAERLALVLAHQVVTDSTFRKSIP